MMEAIAYYGLAVGVHLCIIVAVPAIAVYVICRPGAMEEVEAMINGDEEGE